MPKRSRARGVTDPRARSDAATGTGLAPDLEARLTAVEAHGASADFDRASWAWMVLLGLVLPAVLLAVGWWL
jgi:hypothetical protein